MEKKIYLLVACAVVTIDILLLIFTLLSRKKRTTDFGVLMLFAALTEMFYTWSIYVENYLLMKISLALFFSCMPIMLMFLSLHLLDYLDLDMEGNTKTIIDTFWGLTLLDIILEFINPFKEIMMKFSYNASNIAVWGFVPQPLYYFHLILCYGIVVIIFYYVIRFIKKSSDIYREKYYIILGALTLAVLINAICLVFQRRGMLDYSQISYTVLGLILYWDMFHNSQSAMLVNAHDRIYEEFGHPIVLFGEKDNIALCNESIHFLIPNYEKGMEYSFTQFMDTWNLRPYITDIDADTYFRWYFNQDEMDTVYRVDYRVIKDDKQHVMGRMFVFTDTSLEMDLLTQFHTKEAFEHYYKNVGNPNVTYPLRIVIFDINKLSYINKTEGEEIGDACILYLSKLMRSYFVGDSYFVRLNDANLMVLTDLSMNRIKNNIEKIERKCEKGIDTLKGFKIQEAIGTVENPETLLNVIQMTQSTMKSRKLMDRTSSHSSLLDSFAQTLLESDETTEAHVERTRQWGERLGKRMNFTDYQMSSLSLLCLLHDVGKLGIPLEILNKPSQLTPEEMDIMKTHVEKGYRIVSASEELADIADSILHHHERWDGKGYPDGLEKESIPLLSRIISVIDAYDAMTNDRPYHQAISVDEAKNELRRCSGTQFDPYIVSEFFSLLDEEMPQIEAKIDYANDRVYNVGSYSLESNNVNELFVCQYELDPENYVISIDDNFTELTGYTQEDLETYHLKQEDLIPAEDMEVYLNLAYKSLDENGVGYIEHRIRRKDGFMRHVYCVGFRLYDPNKNPMSVRILVIDADKTNAINLARRNARESAIRSEKRWKEYLRKDSMTGILNHEAFVNDVESSILKTNYIFGMVVSDVDFFKQYNDEYGHVEGDQLLRTVATILDKSVERCGFAGRIGGDEFAAFIMIHESSECENIIKKQMETIFDSILSKTSSLPKPATISMGGYVFKYTKNFKSIYQQADNALYTSKEKGRQCLTINEE